jgi:DHA2 family multidrug resistance protein-like MFS transporter
MSASTPTVRATQREWIGLAVIALPCLLYSMDLTVLNLAVPVIVADLKPTASQILWIVDIYGFLVAGWLITMGTLGDRIGRRKLLLIGAAAFGAASVLAAFANTADTLIAARALLGVAGATLAPSTLSLIRNMFLDDRQRTIAIGLWIASFSAGGAVGPLVGGLLLEHFHWSAIFLIAVPVMVLLLLLGPFLLPEYRDPAAGRIDLPSAVLSIFAVLALIFAVKRVAEHGGDWWAAGSAVAGIVLGWGFIRRQQHLKDPLIDLSLFRSTAFTGALIINSLAFFTLFGFFLFTAQYFQLVLGMKPLEAGFWMALSGLAFAFGAVIAPVISHRFPGPLVTATGLTVVALGFAVMSRVGGPHSLLLLVAGLLILSVGMTPVVALATDQITAAAPPERAGAAAAISETSIEFHGALGIAVLGSVLTVLYRRGMDGALPAELPAATSSAARNTLSSALDAAATLAEPAKSAVATAANQSYAEAFAALSLFCAVLVLGMAGAALLLRHRLQPRKPF